MLARRSVLAGLTATAFVRPAAAALIVPPQGAIAFKVTRSGDDIGSHVLRFGRDGNDLTVNVAIDLKITIALIPVYRYTHRIAERWRDARLVGLDATTDDDGEKMFCRGSTTADSFKVEGSAGVRDYPPDILATSWWNPDTVKRDLLVHSHDGRQLRIGVSAAGKEQVATAAGALEASHYMVTGEQPLELWYGADQVLTRIRFAAKRDKSVIDYIRQ